jgi:hypothetical protein
MTRLFIPTLVFLALSLIARSGRGHQSLTAAFPRSRRKHRRGDDALPVDPALPKSLRRDGWWLET